MTTPQRLVRLALYAACCALATWLGAGAVLDSLANARQFFVPTAARIGTVVVVLGLLSAEFYARRSGLPWNAAGRPIIIRSLGIGVYAGAVGLVLLMWAPNMIGGPEKASNAPAANSSSLPPPTLPRHAIKLEYVRQGQTQAGYLLHLRASATVGRTVFVPVDGFRVTPVLDERFTNEKSPAGQLYGFRARAFVNPDVLGAAAMGRSYGNANDDIACPPEPRDVFLLVTVEGPGGTNPSNSLQFGRLYKSLMVSLKEGALTTEPLEIRINHIPLLAGNDKTRIIER